MASNSPFLNDQHCACLDAVLQSVAQTGKLLQDCKDCGLNVDDFIAQVDAQRNLATALKAKFFPQNP
jgi:hypothetical protein